jgi:hypothetical protein
MQEINIDEKKPNHTKAFLGVGIIVIFVIFFTLYYQSFFGTLFKSSNTQIQKEITGENIKTVLSQTVNLTDKNNTALPPPVTNYLGKWKGEWDFGNGIMVPASLAVTNVVPDVGVTAWYGIENDSSLGITGLAKDSTGGIVMLAEKGQIIGLELTISQFAADEPSLLSFWFPNPANRNLEGEFTHPITGQVVKGSFLPVD